MNRTSIAPIEMGRSALFIDGHYFYKVSSYYKFRHEVRSRLSITGIREFLFSLSSPIDRTSHLRSQSMATHFFCATLTADGAKAKFPDSTQRLQYYEVQHTFQSALRRQGVAVHVSDVSDFAEKGVDVSLALHAVECVQRDGLDTVILLTGDADFVPLAQRIRERGAQVILLGWDLRDPFGPKNETENSSGITTSFRLKQQASRSLPMQSLIEQGLSLLRPEVRGLFISPAEGRRAA